MIGWYRATSFTNQSTRIIVNLDEPGAILFFEDNTIPLVEVVAEDATGSELWMVPLSPAYPPQRVTTNMRLPLDDPYDGWRWYDSLTIQVVTP